MNFKNKYSLLERWNESNRILKIYPDRIPIICECSKFIEKNSPVLDKKKYLVPRDLTVGQFIYIIRKRLKLSQEKAIFIFIKEKIPPSSQMLGTLYEFNKDSDNFLYLLYSFENTFG